MSSSNVSTSLVRLSSLTLLLMHAGMSDNMAARAFLLAWVLLSTWECRSEVVSRNEENCVGVCV